MQIRATRRYHLTLARMAIISKSTNNKCWRGCGEKATPPRCWWEWKLVQPLGRTIWRFLKKLKPELPYDAAIPLLGIYLEETQHPNAHSGTPDDSKGREATRVSISDGWTTKTGYAHKGISVSPENSHLGIRSSMQGRGPSRQGKQGKGRFTRCRLHVGPQKQSASFLKQRQLWRTNPCYQRAKDGRGTNSEGGMSRRAPGHQKR